MRISDWSSDVCSSDLRCEAGRRRPCHGQVHRHCRHRSITSTLFEGELSMAGSLLSIAAPTRGHPPCLAYCRRSEEHTSELQSLMRISYAVFCVKKKKHKT